MRLLSSTASLLCLFVVTLVISSAAGQTSPSFQIKGTVVNRNGGMPVLRCHLAATSVEHGSTGTRSSPALVEADADERGHFTITVPTPGKWLLRASAPGYRPQAFDQHEEFSSAVVLTAHAPSIDLLFRMTPNAAIMGFVLDEANEPVRQAQVSLYALNPFGSDRTATSRMQASATTDDRGHYELPNLGPGDYRLSVQAHPWYATAAQVQRLQPSATSSLDPSLDVVYPVTWFPGVTDIDAATPIALKGGETRQADFQLQPVPSVHLHIAMPASNSAPNDGGLRQMRLPQIQPVSFASGAPNIHMSFDAQGQVDIGGLSPGLYRVQLPEEPGQTARTTLVQITSNSPRSLELTSTAPPASVTVKIDGAPDADSTIITFVDADNAQNVFSSNSGRFGGGLQRRQPMAAQGNPLSSPMIELPPAQYNVYLSNSNYFVTGITFDGKDLSGRIVAIPAGESSLTLHVAKGRASVSGIASFQSKPSVGALVMLVPSTVNDPGSITQIRRDQTDTDGSFEIDNVIPGQYIIVAIDHGWNVSGGDVSTLRHYLMQGYPIDLKPSAIIKLDIVAQLP